MKADYFGTRKYYETKNSSLIIMEPIILDLEILS